jgi:hypothetical protein
MTRPLADVRPERDNLAAEELERLWTDLAGEDVPKAYRAVCLLATAARQAVPFLQHRLRQVGSADPQQLARLIADLDDDHFAVRQKATHELEKLGDQATGALHQVLAGKPSLEVRRRVEQLLQKQSRTVLSPEGLRLLRALEALEQMATPEARQLLDRLAAGSPGAWLTQEAKAARERLTKRPGSYSSEP